MSEIDSSRSRSGGPAGRDVVGDVLDALALGAGLSQVALEVFCEPFIEPEWQIAERTVQQSMGCLVAQVFLETRARVGVDDPLATLSQEERPARRQLGIVKLEKMSERVSIVQDVDLDRFIVGAGLKIEVLLQVALEFPQAVDGRGIIVHREVRKDDERAGPDLVPGRHERLPAVHERRAARGREDERQHPGARAGRSQRIGRWSLPTVTARLPSDQESGRPRRRFLDRLVPIAWSIDRQIPFQSFRGDKPQGRYRRRKCKASVRVRSGTELRLRQRRARF